MDAAAEKTLATMSATKFDSFRRCGYAFFRRYLLGEKSAPSAALAFGKADDSTKNTVYDDKIVTGETTPVGDCQDLFAASFDEASQEVEDWYSDKPDKLRDIGVRLIGAWREQVAVDTQPVATQLEFHVPVPYGLADEEKFDLMGYIDFVEDTIPPVPSGDYLRVISDNKTAGRKWNKAKVLESTQGVAYAVAAERDPKLRNLDISPDEVHFHVAVKTKTPQLQVPATDPDMVRTTDATEREGFLRMAVRTHMAIKSACETGAFLPNRSNVLCSKRWCGFHEACQKEFGGTIKD